MILEKSVQVNDASPITGGANPWTASPRSSNAVPDGVHVLSVKVDVGVIDAGAHVTVKGEEFGPGLMWYLRSYDVLLEVLILIGHLRGDSSWLIAA